HDRHTRVPRQSPRRRFRAHLPDRFGRRPDEYDSSAFTRRGELRVLRQEAITWMDRLRAMAPGGVEDAIDAKVTFRGGSRPDVRRFIGHPHGERAAVGAGIYRDRRDAHFPQRANDADRDLAPIGYQYF